MAKKMITVVIPAYNESENVEPLYIAIKEIFSLLDQYEYEFIFIDNASIDDTVNKLKKLAHEDKRVKIIVNSRNFGHIRSPYYGLLQAEGNAVIMMASDFQDPPELITEFIKKWEEGYKIVTGVKNKSKENKIVFLLRKMFYSLLKKMSETEQVKNFTGFGLYDKTVIDILKKMKDPYPYFRGIISELGFDRAEVKFVQPKRKQGITKNNLYTLYDIAMLGFVNHSKLPLRLAVFIGFGISILSLLVAICYFIYKIIYWQKFQVGMAPLVIGLFFFGAIQLFFIGIIGEYIGAIYTQVKDRPLVIEKERINFD